MERVDAEQLEAKLVDAEQLEAERVDAEQLEAEAEATRPADPEASYDDPYGARCTRSCITQLFRLRALPATPPPTACSGRALFCPCP